MSANSSPTGTPASPARLFDWRDRGSKDRESADSTPEASPREMQRSLATKSETAAHATETNQFLDWARESLSIRIGPELKLQVVGGAETGVVATEKLKAGVECCAIPFNAMLHVGSPLGEVSSGEQRAALLLGEATKNMTREEDILAMRLLYERDIRESRSRWARHIKVMPAKPRHSLLDWKPAEMRELEGTNIFPLAKEWKSQLRHDYDDIVRALNFAVTAMKEDLKTGQNSCDSDDEEVSPIPVGWPRFDSYVWALSMVWSRTTTLRRADQTFKAIIPVFDM